MVGGVTVLTDPLEEGSTTLVDVSKITPGDTPGGAKAPYALFKTVELN